jgi:hypothetical protein
MTLEEALGESAEALYEEHVRFLGMAIATVRRQGGEYKATVRRQGGDIQGECTVQANSLIAMGRFLKSIGVDPGAGWKPAEAQ